MRSNGAVIQKEKDRIVSAKAKLMVQDKFYGAMSSSLRHKVKDMNYVMMTDGFSLYYNPDLTINFKLKDLAFIIAHEVAHVILKHPLRMIGKNARLANEAADYVVNGIVMPRFKISSKLRSLILFDRMFLNKDLDEVYELLKKQQPLPPWTTGQDTDSDEEGDDSNDQQDDSSNSSDDNGGDGDNDSNNNNISSDGDSDGEGGLDNYQIGGVDEPELQESQSMDHAMEKVKRQFDKKVIKATLNCGRNKVPHEFKRHVDNILKPEVDAWSQIRQYFEENAHSDYSLMKPNKLFAQRRIYLPTLNNKDVGKVIIGIDTSGSRDQRQLEKTMGQVSSLLESYPAVEAHVIYWDDYVHKDSIRVYSQQDLPIKPIDVGGGGGTQPDEFFSFLNEEYSDSEDAICIIVFTDLMFPSFFWHDKSLRPDKQVFWLDTAHDRDCAQKRVTFGGIIEV